MVKKVIKTSLVIGTLCIVSFVVLAKTISCCNFCLKSSYNFYKEFYMSKDGRIIDPQKGNITTSEGQSYMLLRSFLMNDKKTFDLVLNWTQNNLKRQDYLFSWLWGKHKDGDYKILDDNSAADADVDIAFALILAYENWNDKYYLKCARAIIDSIWENETKQIGNYLVLMPGVNQCLDCKLEINPSYFSPYAFRLFQKYDDRHDWNRLVDSSYYYLDKVSAKISTGLFPDWFLVENEDVVLENSSKSNFSYDAIRIFPRIYLDYKLTGEKRALNILSRVNFFIDKWSSAKIIYVNYKTDGQLANKDKFIGSIAMLLPVMDIYNVKVAKEIYKSEIIPLISPKGYWDSKNDYYGQNLLWFAMYLYENFKGRR